MSLLEKSSSIELSRRTQPFHSKKQSYSLGQQVQIEVDVQREFLDFQNARLIFDAAYAADTSANASTNNWFASQTIKNLRVKTLAGQMIGHEIREYRAYYQMYKELTSNSDKNTSYDNVMEGAEVLALTDSTAINIQYAHKFLTHIFSIKEYYPAHFHQGILIEYDLPDAATVQLVHESGGAITAPVLTIENVKFVVDLVQLKPEIENAMVKLMEEQRLFADYVEVLTQENTLTATSGLQAYDVVGIDGRVKSIFTYTVQDADRAVGGTDEQYFSTWARSNLGSYRYKLGSNYLNYESIQVNEAASQSQRAEQIFELTKALDIHSDSAYATKAGDSALDRDLLDTKRFATGVKVDKAQKNSDSVISSMIDKDRNNVRVEYNYDSAPTAGTIYTHVVLDKRIQILPGSIIRNVRS